MRFFTKIILLFVGGLTTSIGAFAQNSIKNVPAGWEVKVGDGTSVRKQPAVSIHIINDLGYKPSYIYGIG